MSTTLIDMSSTHIPVLADELLRVLLADPRSAARLLRESPTLARRFPGSVPGTRLYELVPPLPVQEISI